MMFKLLASTSVVATVLLSYFELASAHGGEVSIAEQYEETLSLYLHEVKEAQASKSPQSTFREIKARRDRSFRDLMRLAESRAGERLTEQDCAATALAAEFLKQPRISEAWGRRAVATNPRYGEAYRPLIRSLLNLNRPELAQDFVELGEEHLPETDGLVGMRYFLFVRYRANKDLPRAAEQMEIFLNTVSLRFEAMPEAGDVIAQRLPEAFKLADTEEARRHWSRVQSAIFHRAGDAIESLAAKDLREISPDESGRIIMTICRLHFLRCEIAKEGFPEDFSSLVDEWCRWGIQADAAQRTRYSRAARDAAFDYSVKHSLPQNAD